MKSNFIIIFDDYKNIVLGFFTKKDFLKVFIIGFLIYYIGLYALIRADIYYIDDYYVSIISFSSWDHFSRFFATFLYKALFLFQDFVDISPFSQFLAIILLVLSGMILLYIIHNKFSIIGIISTIPLGLSPYFLENMSYKFDSFFMAFSIFIAIFPFLFVYKRILFAISSIICLILMYITYQASNSIYIVLGIYFSIYFCLVRENGVLFFLIFCFSFIAASLVFKFFIMIPFDSYVSDKIVANLLLGSINNLILYLKYLLLDLFNTQYFILCIVLMICFIFSFASLSNQHKLISLLLSTKFIIFGILFSYGVYAVLQKPLFEPRAFIGIGLFIALLCITITIKPRFYHSLLVILIVFNLIVFANAYGNAMQKQSQYLHFRSELLLRDLININNKDMIVILEGSIGMAYPTIKFINTYGEIADRLIPKIMIKTSWDWSYAPLLHLKMPYKVYDKYCLNWRKNFSQKQIRNAKVLINNSYHSIKKLGSCYIVELKEISNSFNRVFN
ncbi:glucosyltransferase domain-containing protein [Helicobacter sp. MIT 14-3879]|uniref:glucosyltransferase domain-containing protein n=1 Tax=Helicobacter sp. MIT 14-3879 TaxID=2040649 RepID=UPI000E1ECE3F|nr:glucosyltransferase domain-containing protein [Helicobacter sp. MIT 14-3879]RDU64011.1 hypothetical protein CQA44_05055 [Helicobacter sp. MIT 14-3879]